MHTQQQTVKVSEIMSIFTRFKGESEAAFQERIMQYEQVHDANSGESRISRYVDVINRGEILPPVIAIAYGEGGPLALVDGWHRCGAAAMLGRAAVRTVVIPVYSNRQADAVEAKLSKLQDSMSWQAKVEAVRPRRRVRAGAWS